MSKKLLRTCRHEAAHAIVAHKLGYGVKEISTVTEYDEDYKGMALGYCNYIFKKGPLDPLEISVLSLAGHAAEIMWYNTRRNYISKYDLFVVRQFGFNDNSIDMLLEMSLHLVEMHQELIDKLAEFLYVERKISGRKFKKFIKECE